MQIRNVYNGRILIVDLEKGECREEELTEGMIRESIGGATLNLAFYKNYAKSSPLIIGTGILTATFTPASCLAILTGCSPLNGGLYHIPLCWQFGVEMKLSGFDFIVITGKSSKPVRLWLHDEIADLHDSQDVWGQDTWKTTDALRSEYGDENIQILSIGPAGEGGCRLAQLSENYWGSKDKVGLGSLWGEKKLKAIACRGLGYLEVAEGFFSSAQKVKESIINGPLKGKGGLLDMLPSLGQYPQVKSILEKYTQRKNACHDCPYPCNTYLMLHDEPSRLAMSKQEEPGLLCTDISALLAIEDFGERGGEILEGASRLGLDGTKVAMVLNMEDKDLLVKDRLKELARESKLPSEYGLENYYELPPWPRKAGPGETIPEESVIQGLNIFSPAIPPRPVIATYRDFSIGDDPLKRSSWWIKRQALAYILGICPLFILLSPQVDEDTLIDLVRKVADWGEFSSDTLKENINKLISESLSLGEKQGTISPSLKSTGYEELTNKLKKEFT